MKERKLTESLSARISALQNELSGVQWSELSKEEFLFRATVCVKELESIKGVLQALEHISLKKIEIDESSVIELLTESGKLLNTLKSSIDLESEKKDADFTSINPFVHANSREVYWHLHEKLLSFALKGRYLIERVNIGLAKINLPPTKVNQNTRHLLDLLEERESELISVKDELNRVKKKSYLGYLQESSSADIEDDLKRIALEFERRKTSFEKSSEGFEKKISSLEIEFKDLKESMISLEELFSEFYSKNDKLVYSLKKERDLSKKTLLESESDLIELRNRYTTEILTIDQTKAVLEDKVKRDLSFKIKRAMDEAKRNHEAIEHFREILRQRELEIGKLKAKQNAHTPSKKKK